MKRIIRLNLKNVDCHFNEFDHELTLEVPAVNLKWPALSSEACQILEDTLGPKATYVIESITIWSKLLHSEMQPYWDPTTGEWNNVTSAW